jgi:hypothetical protein
MPKIKTVRGIEDRLIQKAEGYRATIVNGAVTFENGEANGVGTFYGQITTNGKPMRLRFVWSQITGTSARWEQAYSPDAGKTWETNWTMEFRRALNNHQQKRTNQINT